MIRVKEYEINDMDGITSTVEECSTQKEILNLLDEMLDNVNNGYDWNYEFENDSFYIEYNDGTSYYAGEYEDLGTYRKKNIHRIIYTNACTTMVYGDYEVNEYGVVE